MTRRLLIPAAAALAAAFVYAPPAAAFDCAKASTRSEQAICADPALKAKDDAMTSAYQAVMARLDDEQRVALKALQIQWLTSRDAQCEGGEQSAFAACVEATTVHRLNYLTATAAGGPGLAKAPLPWALFRKQSKTECEGSAALYRFGHDAATPGEKAFDAEMEELRAGVVEAAGARETSPDFEYDCFFNVEARLTYASPDLAAANVNIETYSGGAHGMYYERSVVIDMDRARALAFADVFPDVAKPALIEACTHAILEEKRGRIADYGLSPEDAKQTLDELPAEMENYAEAIAANVGDFTKWMIYADRAEIYFAPYDVGAYAEGSFVCPLPNELLRKAAGPKGWIVP